MIGWLKRLATLAVLGVSDVDRAPGSVQNHDDSTESLFDHVKLPE